ncbi:MAG: hypothetical protein GY719_05030 [bacterium]|nr:hypothetical protein [bacterium]
MRSFNQLLPFSSRRSTKCGLLFVVLALLCLPLPSAGESQGGEYACWMLDEALEDLRRRGLELIYSSDLVRADMQITGVLDAGPLRQVLQEMLAPFGLGIKRGDGGVLLVVRAAIESAGPGGSAPAGGRPLSEDLVLPEWIDAGGWLEQHFPSADESSTVPPGTNVLAVPPGTNVLAVPPGTNVLVMRVTPESFDDWNGAAFELKNRILDARAEAPLLRVALEGRPKTLEELVSRGLAPYVDAYIYRALPFVPPSDPAARHWWRTESRASRVLARLLEAGDRGDQMVIFENVLLSPVHQAFLTRIQATRGGALAVQPQIEGIDPEQARFFLDPETGNHFLALYADPDGNEVRFDLRHQQQAELLFPRQAPYDFMSLPGATQLDLDGSSPYYLFELTLEQAEPITRDLEVSDTRIVDPYEEVVKNQVFQERQLERFESLDVMEYITNVPQRPAADRITWEHRILQRKGRLTDYHHLGYERNGVPYPEKKLLKGRLFRNEALLQLSPLEVELDETYSYEYLGEEEIDGHRTYKIRYTPVRKGTVDGGNFVSGVVWLDVETSAHRRLRTVQKGLEGSLISQERTYHYEWIPDEGQCYWDWRRREGTYMVSWLGEQYSTLSKTERAGFEFNRPEIEQIAREAYDSDVLIHVETPPEGHRWLVKTKNGGRRLAARAPASSKPWMAMSDSSTYNEPVGAGAAEEGSVSAGRAYGGRGAGTPAEPESYGGRTLADIHAYSTRFGFTLFGQGEGDGLDLYPGLTISDRDFLDRGYQAYAGFFLEDAIFSLSFPNLFDKSWILTTSLYVPYSLETRGSGTFVDGSFVDTSVKTWQDALTVSLAVPLSRRFSLGAAYTLSEMDFEPSDTADPSFLTPDDTHEHLIDLSVNGRFGGLSTELGLELGMRQDWGPWGIDGAEPLLDEYRVLRASAAQSWRVAEHQTLSTGLGYWKGWDLDRFSRLRNGRARAGLPGFDNDLGFDEAILANVSWGTHIAKLPINLRLDQAFEWLDATRSEGAFERTSLRFRFLLNGPFKLDVWPSIHWLALSGDPAEQGDVRFGLFLQRRQ